jgi:hypothetical protein
VGVDNDGAPCCYPNTLPQLPVYPAIVYQFISNTPAAAITQLARFTDFHVQVTLHALDYASLRAARERAARDRGDARIHHAGNRHRRAVRVRTQSVQLDPRLSPSRR